VISFETYGNFLTYCLWFANFTGKHADKEVQCKSLHTACSVVLVSDVTHKGSESKGKYFQLISMLWELFKKP
jgi:hypothetical protein